MPKLGKNDYICSNTFSDHMIIVKNRRTKPETLEKQYPGAVIIDVTSKSDSEYVQFSPFYPHRGIPVPFSPGWKATCVEAIWQGLKVFEKGGIDTTLFLNDTMKGLKRTARRFGRPLGHQKGVNGSPHQLLEYIQARKVIYAPSYLWVLENKLGPLVEKLKKLSAERTVVLLDYNTNGNIDDWSSPLSHASLIKAYIEGNYPSATVADALPEYKLGQWVVNENYGPGQIEHMDGYKVTVSFGSGPITFDQYGNALRPVTITEPFIRKENSNGESAILCMDATGRWGAVANPDKKQEAIPCSYEGIHFYAAKLAVRQKNPTYYFLVKDSGKWGILNKQARQQAPCIYDELIPKEEDGLFVGFSFRKGGDRGMINGKGEVI